ncbi:uncharacterized protein LOC143290403 isoform X2 [Babylonia areolata]|uniref:uncharacterized protein LOC143290403 isoform X2 n=1 Tax=Babylonia areolata TaxID=304850 RepID=UPI003FD26D99
MSFPVNPTSSVASEPQVVSLPQMQRIIQDVTDCVHQLKEEFASSKSPITDDCQVLQRFCAKLEYLLQFEMKERYTMLAKRKDYWDYFCDCLASNKGANDGIKYVKALREHKTSLGKGRAFLRFCLVHQRLADTVQQCAIHPKTVEWYNPGGIWLKPDISSSIINTLYDLNSLHFDLSPRGYDLDNAWPSFARNIPGAGNWNVPASRRSSITSMDTLSLVSTDPSEVSRLQQELASAETARSVLAENVTTLEQERQRAEQSVWMTQGELSALQEQLRLTGKKLEELQQKHSALELSHSQLQAEKKEQEKEVDRQTAELNSQRQQLNQEKQQLAEEEAALNQQLEKERSHFTLEVQTLRQNLIEVTDARDKLTSKLASMEERLEQMCTWDMKKEQQISHLVQQSTSLEQRNKELMDEMARSLSSREHDAASQLESVQKYQDLLSKLTDVETENMQLQGSIIELRHKCDVSEKVVEEEKLKCDNLHLKLTTETERCESLSSELTMLRTVLERERATETVTVEKLQAQITQAQVENDRMKTELTSAQETLTNTQSRQSDLTHFISELMHITLNSTGAHMDTPDIALCSDGDLSQFVQKCQQSLEERFSALLTRLEAAEKKELSLAAERETIQQTLSAIFRSFPDKPEWSSEELTQQMQEAETRVKSLCAQLSDTTANNSFLKEQLQLAQGEQSDKGKELSHLEGRLLELEKALKESRVAESFLQGQVASTELTLKTSQQQNTDLQSLLQECTADLAVRTQALKEVEQEKSLLEKRSSDFETQVAELTMTSAAAWKEVEEEKTKVEGLKRKTEELELDLGMAQEDLEEKQNQLHNMQDKVREGEETVEKFLASMASLETDKASMVTEYDSLQQQLSDITCQRDAAVTETQQQQSDKEKLQQERSQLLQQLSALKEELGRKESEVIALEESIQVNAQKHSQVLGQMKVQMESTQGESSQVREQAHETHDKLLEMTSLKESAEVGRDTAVQKLEQVSSELKEKEVAYLEQLHSLQVQLETFQTENEELRKTSSSSQVEMTKLLTEKQNFASSLEQEKMNLEKHIKSLSEQKQTLETELQEVKNVAASDRAKLKQEFQDIHSKLQTDIEGLKQHNSDISCELERVKSDLNHKMGEIQEARAEIETTRNESDRLRSNSASEKSELEDSLEKLQSRFSKLQMAMDAILREKEELTALQAASQEEIAELKADLASSSDSYTFLLQSSQKVYEEKDSEIETIKQQLANIEHTRQDLTAQLDESCSQRQSLEEKLNSLETLQTKEQEMERVLLKKNKELSDLMELVQKLSSSVAALEEDDRLRREEITRLEEKKQTFSTQVEALEQEVSALQFQLSAEQLQHEESLRMMGDHQNSATEMASRLSDQEAQISDLEKELSCLQSDFEMERTNQNQQLEELKNLLKAKENECRVLAEQLQKASDKLEEAVLSSEFYQKENSSLRLTLDRDIDEREEEIRTLRSDNEQLKRQLVKAIRDKAALWQQTDALAYEHRRKSEGKWMDSSTVTKCMHCQADFSLFLRKHHCRLCGRIFCYNCSDNWVDSTSSSRKARACGQCYTDLQNLDASIAKASLLPDDSDDDSGNVGSDAASLHRSQTESQSQSSLFQASTPKDSAQAGNGNDHSSPVSFGEDVYASRTSNSPESPNLTATSTPFVSPSAAVSDASVGESTSQDCTFQVITQEEVTKSIAAYDDDSAGPQSLIDMPNMSSSMLLSAEDLASGEINTQSETWIKPGRSFAVPISISTPDTVVTWQFTVQPKDIEFSITYHHDSQQPVSQAEVVVVPKRCNSVKEPIQGELTARQAGVYTLVFDNSYSRMTSKKVHYTLSYSH